MHIFELRRAASNHARNVRAVVFIVMVTIILSGCDISMGEKQQAENGVMDRLPASLPKAQAKSYLFPDLTPEEIAERFSGCAVEPDESQVADYVASIKRQSRGIINLLPQSPPPPFSVGHLCVDQSRLDEGWFHWNQAFVLWAVAERLNYRIAVPLAAIDMPEGPFYDHMEGAYAQKWFIVTMGQYREYDPRYPRGFYTPHRFEIRRDFENGRLFKGQNFFEFGDVRLQHYQYSLQPGKYYKPIADYLLSEDLNIICNATSYFEHEESYLENRLMNVAACRIFEKEAGVGISLKFPMKNTRRSAEIVSIALDQIRKTIVFEGGE